MELSVSFEKSTLFIGNFDSNLTKEVRSVTNYEMELSVSFEKSTRFIGNFDSNLTKKVTVHL